MSEEREFLEHARWIRKKMFNNLRVDSLTMVECSNCETLFKAKWNKMNYCPVCGAKMDETGIAIPLDGDEEIKNPTESDVEFATGFRCSLCGSRRASRSDCPECGAELEPAYKE